MFLTLFKNRKFNNGKAPNEQDLEEYSWQFDHTGNIIIYWNTASLIAFTSPFDTPAEREQARANKLSSMLEKLEKELQDKFNLRKNLHYFINEKNEEHIFYSSRNKTKGYTVTITARGIKEICYHTLQTSQLTLKDIPAEILSPNAATAPINIDLKSSNLIAGSLNYYQAMLYLDKYIFSQPRKPHSEKDDIIKLVETIFLKVENTDDLCKLYDYITLPQNKDKINIHLHNIADTIFFWKSNTKSWQAMMTKIRLHAYQTLITEANNKQIVEEARNFIPPIILADQNTKPYPEDQLAYLKKYRNRKLFNEHKTNNPLSFMYNTKTTQDMDRKIAQLKKMADKIVVDSITLSI